MSVKTKTLNTQTHNGVHDLKSARNSGSSGFAPSLQLSLYSFDFDLSEVRDVLLWVFFEMAQVPLESVLNSIYSSIMREEMNFFKFLLK